MTVPTTQYYRNIPDHPVVNSLPASAVILLADLYWHCNAKTGQLNPRIELLGRQHGWSYSKTRRLMAILRDCGIIRAVRGRRASTYEIRPVEEWHEPPCKRVWPQRKPAGGDPDRRNSTTLNQQDIANSPGLDRLNSPYADIANSTSLEARFLSERKTVELKTETAGADVSGSSVVAPEAPTQAAAAPAAGSLENISEETQALILELAPNHPQPGNVHRAAPVLEEILRKAQDRPGTIATIRTNHQTWRQYWAALPAGRFIAQLHRWFRDGDWQVAPSPEAIAGLTREIERKPLSKADKVNDVCKKWEAKYAERQKATA